MSQSNEFQTFERLVKEESVFRNSLYQGKEGNDYHQNKMADMEVRLGNALLKNIKATKKEIAFSVALKIENMADEKNKNTKTNLSDFSKYNKKKIYVNLYK